MRLLLFLAAALLVAACGSAPPAEPDPPPPPEASGDLVAEEEIIEELDPAIDGTPAPPQGPPPPVAPEAAEPEPCRSSERLVGAFVLWADRWIEDMSPLVGCPAASLEVRDWGLSEGEVTVTDGLVRTRRVAPNDSGLVLAADARDGEVVRVSWTLTPRDRSRVVSFFDTQRDAVARAVGADPDDEVDHRLLFRPTPERPYAVDYYRTDDAVVVELVASGEAALAPPDARPAPEAARLAASGASCEDPLPEHVVELDIGSLRRFADRLGCGFDATLAELGLDDPIETATAPDGSTIQTFARPGRMGPDESRHILVQGRDGRLVSIAYLWRDAHAGTLGWARAQARSAFGDPDQDIENQLIWSDGEERPYGVVLMNTPQGIVVQLLDPRWI